MLRVLGRFRVLVLFSTFLFSPGSSFKPFHNIAAGPGEVVSCKREEQQKANQIQKSAKQSLYEAVKGKFVCAGWVKEDTGCSTCVAYDHKDTFFTNITGKSDADTWMSLFPTYPEMLDYNKLWHAVQGNTDLIILGPVPLFCIGNYPSPLEGL